MNRLILIKQAFYFLVIFIKCPYPNLKQKWKSYQKTNNFLIGDLCQVKLSETEQFWIFLAFFLAYAIIIPLNPFHSWQASVYQKAPTVRTMLLSGIMLKMGLYSVIRWQLPIAPLAAKTYMPLFIGLSIAGVIYGSIVALRQRDLKKLLAYSSLALWQQP